MAESKKSVFAILNAIDCNEHTEEKNGLTYLSWAWAWRIVKQNFPNATYTIYERENGIPYFTDGKTAWVKTGVTIEGLEHIEYLPIMDFKNKSIPLGNITSMDMNKAIQRSLTKACARHGLGLYIYANEDLPCDCNQVETPHRVLSTERYMEIVAGHAEGRLDNNGVALDKSWIAYCNPTQEEIDKFYLDVNEYLDNRRVF